MFSFYYVVTYNTQHRSIKSLLNKLGISRLHDNLASFQVRSKMYISFDDAAVAVHQDFELKMPELYGTNHENQLIRMVNAVNPMFDANCEDSAAVDDWTDDCAGSVFYAEAEDEDTDILVEPSSWMFKYEIFFVEDITEWPKNGEGIYSPPDVDWHDLTSTYH
jgi:hypothetical protein